MRSGRRSSFLLLVAALCVSAEQANNSSGKADKDVEFDVGAVQQLISDIDHVVTCKRIPGLAVAVYHAGRPVLVRGFGSARLGREDSDVVDPPVPVTENTKFAIASLSKAFTAALIGILLKEQETRFPLNWGTRVADVMGSDFRFADELRTRETTIRDLLAHRTGLPSYMMALMVGLDPSHSRQDYCRRMRHMEFTDKGPTTFRNLFGYNNVMYLVAGCVAERLGGDQPLEQLMAERLFRPLGMNDTHFISELKDRVESDGRLATMYFWNSTAELLEPLSDRILRTVLPLGAAGGVITTSADMTRWLEFHLNAGRDSAGNQLLPVSYWLQMHSPQITLGRALFPLVRPWFPVSDVNFAYGLGWRLGLYRGRLKSEHPGHLAAFDSKLTIVHSERLAVFTVTNGPLYGGSAIHRAIHILILDSAIASNSTHSDDEPWLNATTACTYPEPWISRLPPLRPEVVDASVAAVRKRLPSTVVPERPAAGWLSKAHRMYVGTYGHLLLGNFSVSFRPSEGTSDGGTLLFRVGSIGRGQLEYTDGQTWLMKFDNLAYFWRFGSKRGKSLPVVFKDRAPVNDDDGQFQTLVVSPFEPLAPPVFRRNARWDHDHDHAEARAVGPADGRLKRSGGILMQLTAALTIMTTDY